MRKIRKNIVIGIPETNLNTDDDSAIRHREIEIESSSHNASVEVVGNELTYQKLSRSQTHWLSIGEKFGAWLVKKKTKP